MAYSVKSLRDPDVVELTLWGLISGADLKAASTECIALQQQTGATRFLADANGWEVVASTLDIYELPAKLFGKLGLSWATRIALILPASLSGQHAARDFATMCQNRGWQVRVFLDRQGAIEWLTGWPPPIRR